MARGFSQQGGEGTLSALARPPPTSLAFGLYLDGRQFVGNSGYRPLPIAEQKLGLQGEEGGQAGLREPVSLPEPLRLVAPDRPMASEGIVSPYFR